MRQPSLEDRLCNRVMTTNQVRDVDQAAVARFGMHSLVLMENAANRCVDWITRRFPDSPRTVILCGPGNNGGDGLVITRHLRARGWDCHCYLLGPQEKFSRDTLHNARILLAGEGGGLRIVLPDEADSVLSEIASAELIIDALLGTGASGNPRAPMSNWIECANASAGFRLAIDIPTGINADSGDRATPYFKADATLTFVALKPSMHSPHSSQTYGSLTVLPIGIPEQQIKELLDSAIS